MTSQELLSAAKAYLQTGTGNRLQSWQALAPELVDMKIFDDLIMGVASATDDYLLSLADNTEAGLDQPPPSFWLDGAKSVVSFFLPFTEQVRQSNWREKRNVPSLEIVHARNEGQAFINELTAHLKETLESAGYRVVEPRSDPRFWSAMDVPKNGKTYVSNWSERHVAWACAVGTFGLHGGIITKVGAAGRLASLITDLELPPTPRPYYELDEYCIKCDVCVANCPADAITLDEGKKHPPCREFIKGVEAQEAYKDRKYVGACAKCQVGVPCERGIPGEDD